MLVAPWPVTRREGLHDNLLMARYFYPRWIDRYRKGELDAAGLRRMRRSCRMLLRACGPLSYGHGKWGWKNPRAGYLIPFFAELYPGMRFIHVIRDGRDHAFHPRFPYVAHQEVTVKPNEMALPDHQRKAAHWADLSTMTADDGAQLLGDRYLRSRLEDLCADPRSETARVFEFLDASNADVGEAAALVRSPTSLGRWRNEPADRIAEVEELIGPTLRNFGY